MYAIVKTGGKQYRAEAGRTLEVERLPAGEGDTVELGEVLMIADGENVTIGRPLIDGARVIAHVDSNGRGQKIVVFKYKSKVRSRKKTGHRQNFTRLTVEQILAPGEKAKVIGRKPKSAKVDVPVPDDGNLDTEDEAAEAIIEMGKEAVEPVAVASAKPAKPRAARTTTAEKKSAKPAAPKSKPAAKAKAAKPAAKKPAKADDKPKAPRRRLPLRRKKETE